MSTRLCNCNNTNRFLLFLSYWANFICLYSYLFVLDASIASPHTPTLPILRTAGLSYDIRIKVNNFYVFM